MAKQVLKKSTSSSITSNSSGFSLIPAKYQDKVFVGLIILSVYIFFWGVISTHEIAATDNFASISFKNYLQDARNSGDFPQWVKYIFGGMPSYGALLTTGDRSWDWIALAYFGITRFMGSLLSNDSVRVMTFYIFYGIGMFLLMRSKKKDSFISLFTALAAVFSTGVIHWIMIGHNTKPITLSLLPFIFMLVEKLREKFSLLYAVLLIFAMHLLLESSHVQMMFYVGIAVGIYIVFELISRTISKDKPISVLIATGVLVVAGGMAFLLSSDRYLAIQEYTPYSVRGSAPVIPQENANNKQDKTGGNSYEYSTMWSFSPQEMITFVVPNYYGFGKLPYTGPETNNETVKLPTYWGQKPFEDVAPYMGIFIFFLAIVGFVLNRKDVFIQFLMFLSIFVLFLSFGNNLSLVFDLFYYNVPSFNKFRAPSMVLALMQFAFPILAGYGLSDMLNWRNNSDEKSKKMFKNFLIGVGAFTGLFVLFAIALKGTYISFLQNSGNDYFQSIMKQLPTVTDFVWSSMISDWFAVTAVLLVFTGLMYLFINKKISHNIFYVSVIVVLLFDLWRVGYRALEIEETDRVAEIFSSNDAVDFIKNDKETFRIADFAMAELTPNLPAYYRLESVGGYHAAKVRSYQDVLDATSGGSTSSMSSPFMWNMLNVKYIVAPSVQEGTQPLYQSQKNGWAVYSNPGYLPRAFFVKRAEVSTARKTLDRLKNGDFDPKEVVFVEKKISQSFDTLTEGSKAEVIEHKNEYMKIKATATSNNLLFLSEVYYPAGWKAFIDGKELEIYRANHSFRAFVVPKGEHTIEMKYHSKGFEQGKMYSTITNYVVVLLFGLGIFLEYRRKKTVAVSE